jgi:branched-chain amino acid transport system ATP-binding protein
MEPLLIAKDVTIFFGGLPAVDEVNFDVQKGEILGLIGPNGAGKTTLLNLISSVYPLLKGEIFFKGEKISGLAPHVIAGKGISRTFQIVKPFPGMTVRENVAVGAMYGCKDHRANVTDAMKRADEILDFVHLTHRRDKRVEEVNLADRKRIELGRALAMRPELLLLDEVMAGLNSTEVENIMQLILKVRDNGVTILVIEHVMKAIMGLCDRVLVLHHGQRIALDTPQEISNDEQVIKAYLGERYAVRKQSQGVS